MAVSTDEASRRIDQFVVDLEEDAKQYGWPEGKIATQQARLRKLIKAATKEEGRGAGYATRAIISAMRRQERRRGMKLRTWRPRKPSE